MLRPGGLFVFDLNNAFGFETWWQYRVALDLEGRHLDTELDYDARARTARAAIGLESGGLERRFLLRERCFSEPEVEGALRAAGLVPGDRGPLEPGQPAQPKQNVVCSGK